MRTDRSRIRRLPHRGLYDAKNVYAILDCGYLAHVGFHLGVQPFVIPTLYGRRGEKLYLHGSAASRMMRHLEQGVPVCMTVTLVDGIVLARTAFNHAMNYRSVVLFGQARKIQEETSKRDALRIISEHLLPGRWDDVRAPKAKELKATSVLELVIDEASAKVRTGSPIDDEEDYDFPVWAGVIPIISEMKEPLPDPRLRKEQPIPQYVQTFIAKSKTINGSEAI
jgi:nitroimidazol reductase NimA-like FMN-containing flavoprotein (pyridoxamine 5'-phosphate oxidase superfamily)